MPGHRCATARGGARGSAVLARLDPEGELGVDGLEKVTRRNLRALDYDTAAISGLRLVGYDRPLPMWLGN